MRDGIIAIVCPDIHGRDFWKEVAEEYDGSVPFIFLGDYLDPYSYEGITNQDAEKNFREIWEFVEKWDNVIPLLGNHDLSYYHPVFKCCRYSWDSGLWYPGFLHEHWGRFKLAHQITNGDITFLLSHAGVHPEWLKQNNLEDIYNADYINSIWDKNKVFFADYGFYRGGYIGVNGSPVWADIREFNEWKDETTQPDNVIQIVGHTQLEKDVFKVGNVYDIDSRQVFVITKDNKVEPYKKKED